MPDITYDVGRVSFVMKGAWNLATSYEKLDAVSYNGSLYIAKQDVPGGTAITNTTYWQLAAEKGDQGETGGVDSVNGQQGDVWFPDSRQLISDGYTTDTVPFLMKGNDSDSDRFELAKKLGNTVAVNQLLPNGDFATSSGWSSWYYGGTASVANSIGTVTGSGNIDISHALGVTIPAGHTVLFLATVKGSASGDGSFIHISGQFPITTSFEFVARIGVLTGSMTREYIARQGSGSFTMDVKNAAVIDLTVWYGSNDRIPSDLLSHPENWGRYYAGSLDYNAGTLESADGTVLKSIGRNLFDKSLYQHMVTDYDLVDSSYYVSAIDVLPNQRYCVNWNAGAYSATPILLVNNSSHVNGGGFADLRNSSGQAFFDVGSEGKLYIGAPDSTDAACYARIEACKLTISLYYSGESGYDQYYPYTVLAEVDTGSEVLRSAGAVADEKTPDGTITRKCYEVTYDGSNDENWIAETIVSITTTDKNFYISAPLSKKAVTVRTNRFVSYAAGNAYLVAGQPNAFVSGGGNLNVYFNQGLTDVSALRTYLSANPLTVIYELATPTSEQGTAFEPLVATVKNGVLSWTNTKGIPVGQESHWFENLRKRVEDRLPDPPSGDGTYRLTCTISGGVKTYSWEA